MAEESLFQDGDNLKVAIGRSLQEKKALLCFVSDDGDESTRWEVALLDDRIRDELQAKTVALRLSAGSEQAGFLANVCPINSIPAVVIIHNAQVIANWQHGQTTFEELLKHLADQYSSSTKDSEQFPTAATGADVKVHMDLSPSEGRMRLPNNAYDHFRNLTERSLATGIKSKLLLHMQLRWLEQMNIDVVTVTVQSIRAQIESLTEAPTLPDEVQDRLLKTPASMLNGGRLPGDMSPAASQAPSASSSAQTASTPATARSTTPAAALSPPQQPVSSQPQHRPNQPASSSNPTTAEPSTTSSSSSQASQRTDYITRQRTLEQSQRAERDRIKAQIATDKAARRAVEASRLAIQRQSELQELRKANSTTANPQASDVRLQVRLFDGSTIRNSFPHDATISRDVRTWIDDTVRQKAAAGGQAGQPYNLKLTLTPLPTRTIEAGEEDSVLSDVEGMGSSATMVMVPVKGYVESYASTAGGGGVTGLLGSAVSGGVGLVGTAAGWAAGGLGRLIGVGGTAASQTQGGATPGAHVQRESAQGGQPVGVGAANVRMRTLADQRRDEDDERRKQGTQLYNGMGLNVQPRKKDDDENTSK